MTTAIESQPAAPPGEALRPTLDAHHRRFSPLYQGFLSDHGPMAALALHGLGRPESDVLVWYDRYCTRLQAFDFSPSGYPELLDEAERDLARYGRDALLARTLPELISGWARNAYHPLIRLAYGYHFQIDGEIIAGLAYLKWCGADERLEQLAASATAANAPGELPSAFADIAAAASRPAPGKRFDDSLEEVVAHPAFATAARRYTQALPGLSRIALTIFDQTHDFFALHLVTGAHAYRLLYPFMGALRDEIFSIGILAGYAAIGAPVFAPSVPGAESTPTAPTSASILGAVSELTDAVKSDDDHDFKLAYSALSQSRHYHDDAYARVATRYLGR